MCGRYTLKADGRSVAKLFDLAGESREFEIEPRYNIAPTQQVAVVLEDDARERELRGLGITRAKTPAKAIKQCQGSYLPVIRRSQRQLRRSVQRIISRPGPNYC